MNKEMSLDVALDIIGTLRMMKIDELSTLIPQHYNLTLFISS